MEKTRERERGRHKACSFIPEKVFSELIFETAH